MGAISIGIRPTKRTLRLRQKGYGLIEIAMGLAIAGLLVAGALMYFTNASESQKINDVYAEVGLIDSMVAELFSGQPDYSSLTESLIANSKGLPSKYVNGSGGTAKLSSAFNGEVIVQGFPPSYYPGWDLLIANVTKSACQKIASAGNQMRNARLTQMVINPTPGTNPSSGGVGSYYESTGTWLPITISACNQTYNVVRFSFGG